MGLETSKNKVITFNKIAGNLTDKPTKQALLRQIAIIQEELDETREAVVDGDLTEFVDGIADVLVTVFGLLGMSERLGVDQEGALDAICDQNLTKFPMNRVEAIASAEYHQSQGVNTDVTYYNEYGRYVIRNDDTGKILKPENFPKIDLSKYIPEGLSID